MRRFLLPLAIFIVLVGFLAVGLRLNPREVPSPLIGKPVPSFRLPQLQAPEQSISPEDLRGKVWLLNVWASWCVSCRQEHPVLIELDRQKKIMIVGLNYKDDRAAAIAWLKQYGGDPYAISGFVPASPPVPPVSCTSAAPAPRCSPGPTPAPRRQVHPAHRGHRRRALDAGGGAGDPRRHAVAGPRTTRARSTRCSAWSATRQVIQMLEEGKAYHCYMSQGGTRRHAREQEARKRKAPLRRPLAARAGKTLPAAARGVTPVIRFATRRTAWWPGTTRSRAASNSPTRTGRPGHRPRRRHADLQLLRGGRRLGHGHHPRHPRRRPCQQHAAPDQHPAGARAPIPPTPTCR
jgi:cytochrome c biogenesis protein CcmG/thiol:disulfide interchange protein DsbE